MSQTLKLLELTFPHGLAQLVWAYFKPIGDSMLAAGQAGYWEACSWYDIDVVSGACAGGHLEMVRQFIADVISECSCLRYACRAGQLDIIRFLEPLTNDFEDGLLGACEGDCVEAGEIMIAKGAHDWNAGLGAAARWGSLRMAKMMLTKGAAVTWCTLADALTNKQPATSALLLARGASVGTFARICAPELKLTIVKLLLRYKPSPWVIRSIWLDAVNGQRFDIIDFMMHRISVGELGSCIFGLCEDGRADDIRHIFMKRPSPEWAQMFFWAAWTGNLNVIAVFTEFKYDSPNAGLCGAAYGLRLHTMASMLALGANATDEALGEVCERLADADDLLDSQSAIQLLIAHGATTCKKCGRPAVMHVKQ